MLPESASPQSTPGEAELRRAFDRAPGFTVGLEEEVMLLDPGGLDLAPVAPEVLARLADPGRFRPELPRAQLEIVTAPAERVDDALAELVAGRRDLLAACEELARPAAAGVHPFASPLGELNASPRYETIRREYGEVARAQLVSSLQVHVAVGGAERSLAVYNALRSHLPDLAALAANAPLIAGRDTGLASVRPLVATLLPRQGLPPALPSWRAYSEALAWGARSGAFAGPRFWWWELRPHPGFGTLEVRVCDAQTGWREAGAIAGVVQALVAWLAQRHDDGEPLEPAPSWALAENRWSACRHGVGGRMADPRTGASEPTRSRLAHLLAQLQPVADRLEAGRHLSVAREMLELPVTERQREIAAGGAAGLAGWLADRYRDELGAEAGRDR